MPLKTERCQIEIVRVSSPFADVCPGGHHVVIDLGDLMRIIICVQRQQLVSQFVGLVHLAVPLLQLLYKELVKEGKEGNTN